MTFCLLDLEFTGFNAQEHEILELGMVFVSDDLSDVLATFHCLVDGNQSLMSVENREFQSRSGLLQALEKGPLVPLKTAESFAMKLMDQYGGELTGHSVHWDRTFLTQHMPRLMEKFSYRDADVTALHTFLEAWGHTIPAPEESPDLHFVPTDARFEHRALYDCFLALQDMRSVQSYLKRMKG